MKLIAHIGTTKTGTKTIQNFLHQNRAILKENGIYYSKSLGTINQKKTSIYCTDFFKTRDLCRSFKITTEAQNEEFKKNIFDDFQKEMDSLADIHTVVVSNEHLHSRVSTEDNLLKLDQLFGKRFDHVEILCYLRPQLDQVISLYSTFLKQKYKAGIDKFIEDMINKDHFYFDFEKSMRLWSKHYGIDNLNVRLFDKTKKLEHGILSDFCEQLDLELNNGKFKFPSRQNVSVNLTGQAILRLRNSILKSTESLSPGFIFKFNNLIEKEFPGLGAVPTPELSKQFHQKYRASTEWVRKTWYPDEQEILVPNWEKFEKQVNQVEDPEISLPLVKFLMEELNHSTQ